jgi:hypothetical protein
MRVMDCAAVLSITLGGALGCASPAAVPRVDLTSRPKAPCVISGPNDPHARAYTAVVPTADGGSAFEDGAVCLEERQLLPAEPPVGMVQLSAMGRVLFLTSPPFDSPPHRAPQRQWVVPLRGVLQVTVSNGASRRFGPGDLLLVTDTSGAGHRTVGIGEPPFETLFVPVE